ncbi:bile acid:sodium symporter family protein [Conexibacter stalactiti]|uniref:Bile acid:sodium symporter family protein n=1 Tax=Conexibacter stalactiti TaxID=1940611 RepID=A0ABU4HQA2_9ACTN|nr:bile acid:sodium symporter family protein [Conexibacter stalactiti]MDW5595425.1 bile acid:sodium symporter family protein [Conexibacter stalactiti]MEC5036067.1 bile acid:sodium symporter family protein [Conexibacter stalactiti]
MEDSLLTTILLPAALGVIMISLGLELTRADFARIARQPRSVAIGLANLLLISPALAFAIATLFDLSPGLAVGLVLLGASPGGTMANVLTHLARGDTALSVTMTAISSLAAAVTVPLYLELAANHFDAGALVGDVAMGGIVARVLLVTVVPVSLGMAIRARWPERTRAARPTVAKVAVTLFLLVVVGAVIAEHETALENLGEVAAAALALNVAAMVVSFSVAKLARLDDRSATAIALELGVHNATLAIAIGASLAAVLTIPAAVYAMFMFVTGGLFARLMYHRNIRV